MSMLHEQLTSQAYWDGPTIAYEQRPSMAIAVGNLVMGDGRLAQIDQVYRICRRNGSETLPIEQGRDMLLPGRYKVLKVVEDSRFTPNDPEKLDLTEDYQAFNVTASEMTENIWYGGRSASATVKTEDGISGIYRSVFYAVNPIFGDWPFAQSSIMLGDSSNHHTATLIQPRPVGHITTRQTSKGYTQKRLVSAELITPAPPKPAVQKARRAITLPTFSFGNASPAFGTV